jgi:spermidine synthase
MVDEAMSEMFEFEEIDYKETPLGALSLRRRSEPRLGGRVIYEVKLGEDFLMSSLFVEAEEELATLALQTQDSDKLDIIVGGLGLGYTAAEALKDDAVRSMVVVELMEPVIEWHRLGLVPIGDTLAADPRCSFVQADFFELATSAVGFDSADAGRKFHAILLDIDHAPGHVLNDRNRTFYTSEGLTSVSEKLHPGGVFGLWSNDPPDDDFSAMLDTVFASSEAHVVSFANPYTGGESANTVYLAQLA